jgi:hypothetical protein
MTPTCERCAREEATALAVVDGRWLLVGDCTRELESYYIEWPDYLADRVRWHSCLGEKSWFVEDDFLAAVERANAGAP